MEGSAKTTSGVTIEWKFVDGGSGGAGDSTRLTVRNGGVIFDGTATPQAAVEAMAAARTPPRRGVGHFGASRARVRATGRARAFPGRVEVASHPGDR